MEKIKKITLQKEGNEEEPKRTRILLLTSSHYGEQSGVQIPLQIDADFDVKAAKEEFSGEDPRGESRMFGDVAHEDFAAWLVKKGLAREVDVTPFHEGN